MADKKEKVSIFSTPEEIDAIITTRINSFCGKGGKKASAWTDEEKDLRNAVVLDYLAGQGLSREQTAQQLSSRWGVTMGTARNYVSAALKDFAEYVAESDDAEKNRKLYIERLEGILQTALAGKSLDAALRAMEIYGKTMGYFNEKKDVNLTGDATFTFDFS